MLVGVRVDLDASNERVDVLYFNKKSIITCKL